MFLLSQGENISSMHIRWKEERRHRKRREGDEEIKKGRVEYWRKERREIDGVVTGLRRVN